MTKPPLLNAKCCPKCRSRGKTVDSRLQAAYVRRRYVCKCGNRWTTAEFLVSDGSGTKDKVDAILNNRALSHVRELLEPLRGLLEGQPHEW